VARTLARLAAASHDDSAPEVAPRRWFGVSLVIGVMGLIMVGVLLLAVLPTRAWFTQRRQLAASEQRLAVLKAENRKLSDQLAALQNPAEVQRVARDQFNLVKPGEQVINVLPLPALSTAALPDEWPYSVVRSIAAARRASLAPGVAAAPATTVVPDAAAPTTAAGG
jgi:cell division protein FtsB